MNLQDETIQLIADLVEREQPPDCQDYDRRFRALLNRFRGGKAMQRDLLALTDLRELIVCRRAAFHFQAGVQSGPASGSIAVLSGPERN